MKKLALYSFVLLGLVFGSCKKTPLPVEDDKEPVFRFTGTVDGLPTNLTFEAGNDGYFMRPSDTLDANNIYVCRGDLQKNCTPPCAYGLSVLIYDTKTSSSNDPMDIKRIVHGGPYLFNDKTSAPKEQELTFVPYVSNIPDHSYTWKFADSHTTIEVPLTYSLTRSFQIGTTYSVTFVYDDNVGGCSSTLTNVFHVGNPYQATITAEQEGAPLAYRFSAVADGKPDYTYKWEFGDGKSSSAAAPLHTYGWDGVYTSKLTMIDANGDSCISFHQVSTQSALCQANYHTAFLPVPLNYLYKTITILLTDPDGTVYSSNELTQPSGSHINISKVDQYKPYSKKATNKVTLDFDCLLKNGAKTIAVTNATAVIAVSYE